MGAPEKRSPARVCHLLSYQLPHLAVTYPLCPANECGYRGSPAQGSSFDMALLRNEKQAYSGGRARQGPGPLINIFARFMVV